jgi:hypothetical protein
MSYPWDKGDILTATDLNAAILDAVAENAVTTWNGRSGTVTMTAADVTAAGGALAGSGLPEAPTDGQSYTRRGSDHSWQVASSGGGGISDAPNDGTAYARKSLAWAHLTHTDITDWAATLAPYALTSAVPGPSSTTPAMDGAGAAGSGTTWSRGDHVHPTDTSRYAAANPSGYQTAANVTATLGPYALTSSVPAASSTTPAMDGAAAIGAGTTWARADHVHPSDTSRYAASNPSGFQTAAQVTTSLAPYAPLAAPVFTGDARAVTPAPGDNDTSIATTAFVASAVSAATAGAPNNVGRNRLHNSGFSVNQRTYVSGTALAAAAYGHDRWKAGASGCTYTFTQTQPFTTITITAGSLQQIVETMNVEGGAYVLSWTGTAQGRINAGTYAASPVTVTGLAANTAITVEFNAGTVGGVQLEPGGVATSIEKRDPMLELALCQRFYQFFTNLTPISTYTASSFTVYGQLVLPVQMRATPSIGFVSFSYVNASGAANAGSTPAGVKVSVLSTAAGQVSFTTGIALSADL